nr:hypothetical protein [Tanacetum cinerariifolium]
MADEYDETSKDKEIDKLIALISLSFKKIYKPTNNNLRTSSNTSRANQDNSPRINKNAGYENQRIGNVAGARENVGYTIRIQMETQVWKENVNPNVRMPLGNASRSANVMDTMTSRRSTVSNTPLSSNSFTARSDCPIHRRLWVFKAHDGKSQASN